jgi:hypothetical protein
VKVCVLILQEIGQSASYTTVMTLENKVILLDEEITPTLVLILLTVPTVRASEVI